MSQMFQNDHKKNHRAGFTMIELLVVATILIVLTTLGLVSYQTASQRARDGKRDADMESIRAALLLYRADQGQYPDGDFDSMVSELYTEGYYSSNEVNDPREGDGGMGYTYTPAGGTNQGFIMCYTRESDEEQTCIEQF